MCVLFQLQKFPLQKVTYILTLFWIIVLCFIFILFFFPFITIVRFIPVLEISTTEGNEYLNTICNCCSLFYLYVVMFSDWQQLCVSFQLQRSPLQKVTNILTLFQIIVLFFIFISLSFLINTNCVFYSSSRDIHFGR